MEGFLQVQEGGAVFLLEEGLVALGTEEL